MTPPHTVAACVADLHALAKQLQSHPSVVIGHSFGGRVALAYATSQPDLLEQVWVLDATPGDVADSPDTDITDVIATLREVPQPLQNRSDVVEFLSNRGYDETISRWMSTNLRRTPQGLVWRFDLDVVVSLIEDYFVQDLWELVETPASEPEVHLVQAERSNRWTPRICQRLESLPSSAPTHLHVLAHSDHWVHVDNPEGLLALLEDWI